MAIPKEVKEKHAEELRRLKERISNPNLTEEHDRPLRGPLRRAADEHAEILRRSKELGNGKIYK